MKTSLSWLREYVELPADADRRASWTQALVDLGIEVESIVDQAATVKGDLVVGRVLEIEELTGFKKPIRFCRVDVGQARRRRRSSAARSNFAVGDLVVVILPGGELPGGFKIGARKTYGRNSNGMICSAARAGSRRRPRRASSCCRRTPAAPGADARPVVGLDDVLVEVEITPDRGYEMSVRGMARELSLRVRRGVHRPGARRRRRGATAEPPYPVRVDDTVGCDRFAARVVRGIDPAAPSPEWMQRRLITAGIRTISLPVDITNYVMLELGQPMHVFDLDLLRGGLVVRRATPGEKLTTLDGVARVLDAEDMVICDDSGPISLAAVMGGETSEWQPDTVDVLLEAAHWDPVMVGRTARRHKLFSEAAKRWERGVDPQLPLVALERAVALLTEHAGGTVDERVLDIDHVRAAGADRCSTRRCPPGGSAWRTPTEQVAGAAEPGRLRGHAAPTRSRSPRRPGGPTCSPRPTWSRRSPGSAATTTSRASCRRRRGGGGLTPAQRRRRIGRPRDGRGRATSRCCRTRSSRPRVRDALGLPADDPRRSAVRLTNPLSEEEPLLRTSLLPPLLGTLKRNLGRGQRDLALYETGTVFLPRLTAAAPPVMGVDRRPVRRGLGGGERDRAGAAVAPRGGADRRLRRRPAGGARAARPPGRTRSRRRGSRSRPRACPPNRVDGTRRPSTRRGTRAAARRSRSTARSSGTPGELHPARAVARSSCPSAPARWSSTWTRSRRRR